MTLGSVHYASGDYDSAVTAFRRSADLREPTLGSGHPDFACSLRWFAGSLRFKGDYRLALPLARRATGIIENTWGAESTEYAENLYLLGNISRDWAIRTPSQRYGWSRTCCARGSGRG